MSASIFNRLQEYELLIIAVSVVLMLIAGPLCRWLDSGRRKEPGQETRTRTRVRMMRSLNLLIVLAILAKALLPGELQHVWLGKLAHVLIVVYFAVLSTQIINFMVRQRYGKRREVNDTVRVSDSYASRGISLLLGIFIAVLALVASLQILGLSSLLQAGGVIGLIGLTLALTQASWAPDIIGGLIILNSRLCEEGDVIQVDLIDNRVMTVFKTKLFHTELLDLANNHRMMIRNGRLRDGVIQNLSRFASAKGLREGLYFNIGYEHSPDAVRKMFDDAFEQLDQETQHREEQHAAEIQIRETDNYAVTWAVFYYIKDVKRILQFRHEVRAAILAASHRHGISLSTPILQDATVRMEQDIIPASD